MAKAVLLSRAALHAAYDRIIDEVENEMTPEELAADEPLPGSPDLPRYWRKVGLRLHRRYEYSEKLWEELAQVYLPQRQAPHG